MSNIRRIEELKANILCIIADLFRLLTKGGNIARDSILDCISGAIMALYMLGEKLGYGYKEVDDDIRKKLEQGIKNEEDVEKEGKTLSRLLYHFKDERDV